MSLGWFDAAKAEWKCNMCKTGATCSVKTHPMAHVTRREKASQAQNVERCNTAHPNLFRSCSQGAMILVAAHVLNTNRRSDLKKKRRICWIWKWTSVCRLSMAITRIIGPISVCPSEAWNLKQAGRLPLFSTRCNRIFFGLLMWKHWILLVWKLIKRISQGCHQTKVAKV